MYRDKVNEKNIDKFIHFLYRYKHGTNAPYKLIIEWKKVPRNEIHEQLENLFDEWEIDEIQRSKLFDEFYLEEKGGLDKFLILAGIIFLIFYYLVK